MTKVKLSCPACSAHVVPGTLYCWKCSVHTKIGEYGVLQGQLSWTAVGREKPNAIWVVLDGGDPIALASAKVIDGSRPVALELRSKDGNKALHVEVAQLIKALVQEEECVHAVEAA